MKKNDVLRQKQKNFAIWLISNNDDRGFGNFRYVNAHQMMSWPINSMTSSTDYRQPNEFTLHLTENSGSQQQQGRLSCGTKTERAVYQIQYQQQDEHNGE